MQELSEKVIVQAVIQSGDLTLHGRLVTIEMTKEAVIRMNEGERWSGQSALQLTRPRSIPITNRQVAIQNQIGNDKKFHHKNSLRATVNERLVIQAWNLVLTFNHKSDGAKILEIILFSSSRFQQSCRLSERH